MNNHLVISALGKDRPGIVNSLTKAILEHGGNISESRMTVLGGEFAIMLLVSGNEAQIHQLQQQLPATGEELQLTLISKPTEGRAPSATTSYQANVSAMDHPGIIHNVTDFFARQHLNIEEVNTSTYPAPHTGTPMFALDIVVKVPDETDIKQLEEDFSRFCAELNLDVELNEL